MFNNTLSKSTLIMFFFDLITLVLSTVYWYNHFNLPFEHMDIAVLLTTLTGIIVLFLKDNYKIREFNSTKIIHKIPIKISEIVNFLCLQNLLIYQITIPHRQIVTKLWLDT